LPSATDPVAPLILVRQIGGAAGFEEGDAFAGENGFEFRAKAGGMASRFPGGVG
jgi:hypothetical protein